ncbi:hypothetical protein FC99_GL002465 [Levilactobacillus koreensis JCM 16448]|uniref:DUF1048 domain-containing protein n=1 Tax=Levilactobacillus koreensis TaxID=637971 RepID=A0AAC8UUU0_9LACO|nr:DUF1048 domain-containing protein [Levilactobacillus koreensis]AKP64911.1 hypothetical protein ABN16_07805 [Levilactobacillus koreensis]KRK91313.1 hypothetical protein FC99_GL002465 [Levilactobacillus koreensis JCM 16448]
MINYIKKMWQDKRDYREFKRRVAALPAPYAQAMKSLEKYLWNLAGGNGEAMYTILKNVLDMFESAAADGVSVDQIVGDDLAAFADNLLEEFPEATWVNQEKKKLQHKAFKD